MAQSLKNVVDIIYGLDFVLATTFFLLFTVQFPQALGSKMLYPWLSSTRLIDSW